MARLIRMDQTGHTTLAEWTAGDPAAAEAAVAAFREQLDAGYYAVVSTGEGHAEQVRELPLGRRARDPAPPDRRRVSAPPRPARDRGRLLAAAARRRAPAPARPRLDAQHARPHDPVPGHGGAADGARAALVPGRRDRRRARVGDPRAVRQPRRERRPRRGRAPGDAPERTALGLLGDLLGHEARELHARTGLALERGAARRLARRRGGRAARAARAAAACDCWCVKVDGRPSLPSADRTAHLLLALREDEVGFATVANLAFSGAAVARAPAAARARCGPRSTPRARAPDPPGCRSRRPTIGACGP